jgi:hypothetical protein
MSDGLRANRYRRLFVRLGEARARSLLDHLQVLALTRPETVRELEAFIDRNAEGDVPGKSNGPVHPGNRLISPENA